MSDHSIIGVRKVVLRAGRSKMSLNFRAPADSSACEQTCY